jgi:hypothetical protein
MAILKLQYGALSYGPPLGFSIGQSLEIPVVLLKGTKTMMRIFSVLFKLSSVVSCGLCHVRSRRLKAQAIVQITSALVLLERSIGLCLRRQIRR